VLAPDEEKRILSLWDKMSESKKTEHEIIEYIVGVTNIAEWEVIGYIIKKRFMARI